MDVAGIHATVNLHAAPFLITESLLRRLTIALVGAPCLHAVYDPVTRRCTMASAGHPPPLIVGPRGGGAVPDPPPGAPLGLGLVLVTSVESIGPFKRAGWDVD